LSMENQNNQNDKPADGYVQAPQQEAKSVLAELAEFVSRKKVAEQNVAAPAVEAKQDAQQNAEKERNTAGTESEEGGAPVNDGAKEEKSERPARNNRSRGPRRPRTAAPKRRRALSLLRMRKRRKKENRKLREVPAAQQPERKKQRNRLGQSVQTEQKKRSEQSVRPKTRNRQELPRQRMCWQIPAPSRRYALSR